MAMSFSELFIRRPVLSTVVSLLILLLGAQGIASMSIRQYPKVDETVITVTTAYPGASADVIQGFITSTDRQGGVLGRGRRLRHLEERAWPLDGVSLYAPQRRPQQIADRGHRQGAAGARAVADRRQGSGHPEGHRLHLRADVSRRAQRHHEPAAADGISDAGGPAALRHGRRRRRRADPRRAGIRHARLARSGGAGRAQRHRDRRADRHHQLELPVGAGQDQERVLRLFDRGEDDAAGPGDLRAPAGPLQGRRHRPAPRRREDRARRRLDRRQGPLQRPGRRLPRHLPDPGGQSARRRHRGAEGAAGDPDGHAPRHDDRPRLRFDRGDQRLDPRGVQDDRRGGGHRRRRHPPLPRLVPLGGHPDRHHPAVADRRLLPAVGGRLFAEHADAARHGARHRPRRRRRHRRGREHPSPHRGGLHAARGRDQRHARDFRAGRRHDDHACRGLRADRLHHRHDRLALPRIRGDARRRGGHLGLHRAHRLADDVGAASPRRRRPLPADRRPHLRARSSAAV